MNISIKYKKEETTIENLPDHSTASSIRFLVINTLLPRLNISSKATVKDFKVKVEHPDKDKLDHLKTQITAAIEHLYW